MKLIFYLIFFPVVIPCYLKNKLGATCQPSITIAVELLVKVVLMTFIECTVEPSCLVDVEISANRKYSPFQY